MEPAMAATRTQKRKTARVMREFKHGQLKSGRSRAKVRSRKQAIAIAMSESGQSWNRKKKGAKRTGRAASRGRHAEAKLRPRLVRGGSAHGQRDRVGPSIVGRDRAAP
jgi:Family of unknown function (DUF6496)